MAEMKLKEMPQLNGRIPMMYDREVIYSMCLVINAHSRAIDFLSSKIEKLEERIKELENG